MRVEGINTTEDGTARTLTTAVKKCSPANLMHTDGRGISGGALIIKDEEISVKVKEATKQGYAIARGGRDAINLAQPRSQTRRGRVGVDMANTLDTSCNQGIVVQIAENVIIYAVWYEPQQCYVAIRKLTPKECFRLQGWSDDYFEKAAFVNFDSQLYKQAGNGVTVNVAEDVGNKIKEAKEC